MKCPVCGGRPARIYKCTSCGEIRCGQDTCKGNKGGPSGWAGAGAMCRTCGEGRYQVLGFFSKELEDLMAAYKGRMSEDSENG